MHFKPVRFGVDIISLHADTPEITGVLLPADRVSPAGRGQSGVASSCLNFSLRPKLLLLLVLYLYCEDILCFFNIKLILYLKLLQGDASGRVALLKKLISH